MRTRLESDRMECCVQVGVDTTTRKSLLTFALIELRKARWNANYRTIVNARLNTRNQSVARFNSVAQEKALIDG